VLDGTRELGSFNALLDGSNVHSFGPHDVFMPIGCAIGLTYYKSTDFEHFSAAESADAEIVFHYSAAKVTVQVKDLILSYTAQCPAIKDPESIYVLQAMSNNVYGGINVLRSLFFMWCLIWTNDEYQLLN
jgi:hypothetical protein